METSICGVKHICSQCAAKYYDLRGEMVSCPKCGAQPHPPKVRKGAPAAKKSGSSAFGG